ncbi:MAG: ATP-binding protein [Deltaproteobacteria bacterium]|nr:ATP-binding protein [Deltaproteobacteria bacterium]
MRRIYEEVLEDHFKFEKNMAFLAGPRQSGKTTTALDYKSKQNIYWNWDDADDRIFLRSSPARFFEEAAKRGKNKTVFILDEIHKNPKWRNWLKGIYDKHHRELQFVVTGSARLNVFHRGGDSLLGRYYLYRHHPLSLGEISNHPFEDKLFRKAQKIPKVWSALSKFGGFPQPFLAARESSHQKWIQTRRDLLIREDLRDLSRIEDLSAIELLVRLLSKRAAGLLNTQNLAQDLDNSVDTVRRWIQFLQHLFYIYTLQPYRGTSKTSLKKMPKIYLWDWSEIEDEGARFENMIASHLLKSVHYWTDTGLGEYELYYIRDKQKREVDFLVTEKGLPFLLVEAKLSDTHLSPSLQYYSNILKPKYSLQVVQNIKAQGMGISETRFNAILAAEDFCSCLV